MLRNQPAASRESWTAFQYSVTFSGSRWAQSGSVIVLTFIICVIFAPLIAPYDYARQDIPSRMQGPSAKYLLGTDNLGRDIFSRLVYGSRIAFGTALPSVAIALTVGTLLGLIAGYRRRVDRQPHRGHHGYPASFPLDHALTGDPGIIGPLADQRDHRDRPDLDAQLCPCDPCPDAFHSRESHTWRQSARWAQPIKASCFPISCPTPSRRRSCWQPWIFPG